MPTAISLYDQFMIYGSFYCIKRAILPRHAVIWEHGALFARAALLIPKGQSHSCHFCPGLDSFICNQLFNCPLVPAQRPTADRHLGYCSGTQQQHSWKKRTLVVLIPLWFQLGRNKASCDPKAERPGSQRRLLPLHIHPQPWNEQEGSWHRARNICGSLAPRVPHLRDFPNYGAISGSRRRGVYFN